MLMGGFLEALVKLSQSRLERIEVLLYSFF